MPSDEEIEAGMYRWDGKDWVPLDEPEPSPVPPEVFNAAMMIVQSVLEVALQLVKDERAQKSAQVPEGPGTFIPQGDLK